MAKKPTNILILTSTYPRWDHDSTPGFVADFAAHIAPNVDNVYVLAPHFASAAHRETTGNVHVARYRYFFPASAENIAYSGGAVSKIKKTPVYAVKLLCFMAALFFSTLYTSLTKNISVINAHWLVPQGFAGLLVKFITGHKLVITIHGGDVLTLNGKYMRIIKSFILRHADTVCVNSSVTKDACVSLYDRDYEVIPMGINFERYQAVQPSAELAACYNLNDFTILFVGRLAKEKGVIYLLQAAKLLKDAGASFKTLIVGSGPLEDELKAYIRDNNLTDVVTMVGWVDSSELPQYYATATVYVGPSLHEAQGLVFLEALATGLPVVTTDQGGMKDFIRNGENGFMVPAQSPQALFDILARLYNDRSLLYTLHQQAASSVAGTYSWDAVTKAYVPLLKDLVA